MLEDVSVGILSDQSESSLNTTVSIILETVMVSMHMDHSMSNGLNLYTVPAPPFQF